MGEIGLGQIVIAVGLGALIWLGSMRILRMIATPPPDVDPADVVEVEDQDFRCTVCGTEVTLRVANVTETAPPRHCHEEMTPIWRPDRHTPD
jgi:hypothetical protein